MHEIHRPNGGEGRASEHAAKAYEAKGGENEDDSKRFAARAHGLSPLLSVVDEEWER